MFNSLSTLTVISKNYMCIISGYIYVLSIILGHVILIKWIFYLTPCCACMIIINGESSN